MDDSIESPRLKEIKPNDRVNGYPINVPRWYTRFFEIFPGIITWGFILSPLIFTLLGLTKVLIYYVSFLTVYWSYRGIRFLYGLVVGVGRMNKEMNTNWVEKIQKLDGKEAEIRDRLKYLYICPVAKESMDTLHPAIDAWAKSDIGASKISVVFGIEQRFEEIMLPRVKKLQKQYKNKFREIVYYIHPNDIPGEVIGVKGANLNWATRQFVKDKVTARKESLSDYLLITCDSDLRPHKKYLSAVTYKYLINPSRKHRFFATAVHTFNNNIWRVPPIVRVQSMVLSIVILHNWVVAKKNRETFSSYVVNLETVDKVQYWDPTIGIDDTPFYWNALIRLNGDFCGEEVYVPTHSDAVENATFLKTHKSLYLQQLRWGWGIITVPMTFAGLYKNKTIPLDKKLNILVTLFDNQILFLTVVYSLTFTLPILNLIDSDFQFSSASYNLPAFMSNILTVIMLLNVPIVYLRRKVTPIPKGWGISRHIFDLFETFLITVNMLTFAFIPFVQAQSELMFGKGFRKNFYATERVAIRK